MKREVNSKFLPWDYIPYKDQIKDYFKTVRKLSGERVNPKANFPPNIVSNADIVEVFGLSSEGFKTTNLNLHPKTKKDLLRLYWKVYGIDQMTNNKFMIWFLKGYITQKKGEKVNWARVATSTTQEKAHREEAKLIKNGSIDFFGKGGKEGSNKFDHKFYKSE